MKNKLLLLFGILMLTIGCGPTLSHTQDYSIAVGEFLEIPFDPVSGEQTIKVVAKSPGKPIKVHVYLAEDAETVNQKITFGKPADMALAKVEESEDVSLTAKVPAGKEVIVRLQPSGATSADVHLEVTN